MPAAVSRQTVCAHGLPLARSGATWQGRDVTSCWALLPRVGPPWARRSSGELAGRPPSRPIVL